MICKCVHVSNLWISWFCLLQEALATSDAGLHGIKIVRGHAAFLESMACRSSESDNFAVHDPFGATFGFSSFEGPADMESRKFFTPHADVGWGKGCEEREVEYLSLFQRQPHWVPEPSFCWFFFWSQGKDFQEALQSSQRASELLGQPLMDEPWHKDPTLADGIFRWKRWCWCCLQKTSWGRERYAAYLR